MKLEGLSFPEAARKLADLCGVVLPQTEYTGGNRHSEDQGQRKGEAYALLQASAEHLSELLRSSAHGEAGRNYLKTREITPEIAESFGLGYAPHPQEAGWDSLCSELHRRGLSMPLAEELGLAVRSERRNNLYDRFRGRLMFPIAQPGGQVVGFSGRVVPPHDAGDEAPPKYVNSPESLVYHKGKVLFGLPQARRAIAATGRIVLVEGNIDVVRLHQFGVSETVAPLGTALTREQAHLMRRFASTVVLCFDGDAAGKKAAWKALPILLEEGLDVRLVFLPEGEDPDSLGASRMLSLLSDPTSAVHALMLRMAQKAGSALSAKARAVDELLALLVHVPGETERALCLDTASTLFGVPRGRLEATLSAQLRAKTGAESAKGAHLHTQATSSTTLNPVSRSVSPPARPFPGPEAELLMFLVDKPQLAPQAMAMDGFKCVTDPRLTALASRIAEACAHGRTPSMPELLEHLDPAEHRLAYETIFSGRYRDSGDAALSILHDLLARCEEHVLEQEIRALDQSLAAAKRDGRALDASQMAQARLQLRRKQLQLRVSSSSQVPSVH